MRQLSIKTELREELDRFRAGNRGLELAGMKAASAQALVREMMLAVVNRAGTAVGTRGPCFAAAREFSRLARTRQGPALATEIELWLRKWTALGLDSSVLQEVALTCLRRFGRPVTQPLPEPGKPKRTRKRRSYAQAIQAGTARAGSNIVRQVEEHRQASERSRAVSGVVKEVLAEHGIPGREFVRYNAFAYQMDKRQRRHGGKTLETARKDLLDLWTAKGLNPTVLSALADNLSRLPIPD